MSTAKERLLASLTDTAPTQGMKVRVAKYVSVAVSDLLAVAEKTPDHPQAIVFLQALAGSTGTTIVDAVDLQALLEGRDSVEINSKVRGRVHRSKVLV